MPEELLKTAVGAARLGAEILERRHGTLSAADADEKGRHDFVTRVDRESESAIIDHIRRAHPDHSILAEESGYHEQKSEVRWIVDPLDGTTNFIHGYPVYAVSIAAQSRNEIVAACVIDVTRHEEFTAARGYGAFLNGKPIRVSQTTQLDKSLILTGFPFKAQQHMEDFITVFRELLPATSGIRRAGSAAIDLAHIACGRAEGFWEFGLSAWDIAAGALLIEKAGGVITDVELGNRHLETGHVLAGNSAVHAELNRSIRKHFEPGHFIG
jgi:myo-inositol-1(or 4)-monophosphatase